ncbi:MAG TPA: pilus assembly protein [Gammaproteobacteria bacterium]|nr:pilus assembly protein [Gammaproteobacteria bacterium]
MKRFFKQLGQGMTEYIIIVALIAIAAIAAYSFFGKTVRNQVGGMAAELSGQSASTQIGNAKSAATSAGTEADKSKGLDTYQNK